MNCWHGFIGVDWEVDWGILDMMLSLIALEATGNSQNFQKCVMEHNRLLMKKSMKYWLLRFCEYTASLNQSVSSVSSISSSINSLFIPG